MSSAKSAHVKWGASLLVGLGVLIATFGSGLFITGTAASDDPSASGIKPTSKPRASR
jgi:hypothetical protein